MSFERSVQTIRTEASRPTEGHGLSKDVIFDLLKNGRRRDIIEYLIAADRMVTIAELSEHIAARENDIPLEELTSTQRKRVYVALYQTHLPKLDDAGVIDYESNRGTVLLTERVSALDPYLGDVDDTENGGFGGDRSFLKLGVVGGGTVLFSHAVGAQELSFHLSLVFSFAFTAVLASVIYTHCARQ